MKTNKIFKLFILTLFTLILMNAWLPPTPKTKILIPIYESMKTIDALQTAVTYYCTNVDSLKRSADNIPFSAVHNIKETNLRSDLTTALQSLLEASPLLQKEEYLSGITNFRSAMTTNLYTEVSNITGQLYDYKKTHAELEGSLPEYMNKVQSIPALMQKSIEISENQLKQSKSVSGMDQEIIKKNEAQFTNFKLKLLERTNVILELKNALETSSADLTNMQKSLIAKLNNEPSGPDNSQDKIKSFKDKSREIMELSKSLLSKEMQKAIEYFQNNETEKAKEIFQDEIKKDADNWMARKYMASIYIKEGKFDLALEEINRALESFKKKMK